MHNKFLIMFITMLLIIVILSFIYINKKVSPVMISIAEEETNSLGSIIINDSVHKYISNNLDYNKLFIITYNSNNEIETIDLDTIVVNKVITNINNNIQLNLKYLELGRIDKLNIDDNLLIQYSKKNDKGIIYELPISLAYSNPFIANISPKIPVKINVIGNVNSTINNTIKNYGINNILLETYLDIEVTLQVILPYQKDKTIIKNHIPIGVKIIKGNIPNYYSGGGLDFSVPVK